MTHNVKQRLLVSIIVTIGPLLATGIVYLIFGQWAVVYMLVMMCSLYGVLTFYASKNEPPLSTEKPSPTEDGARST